MFVLFAGLSSPKQRGMMSPNKPQFQFGNIVVVDGDKIGVIVKTLKVWPQWSAKVDDYTYDIYVRSYNGIREYPQSKIAHFVFSKELSEEEKGFY